MQDSDRFSSSPFVSSGEGGESLANVINSVETFIIWPVPVPVWLGGLGGGGLEGGGLDEVEGDELGGGGLDGGGLDEVEGAGLGGGGLEGGGLDEVEGAGLGGGGVKDGGSGLGGGGLGGGGLGGGGLGGGGLGGGGLGEGGLGDGLGGGGLGEGGLGDGLGVGGLIEDVDMMVCRVESTRVSMPLGQPDHFSTMVLVVSIIKYTGRPLPSQSMPTFPGSLQILYSPVTPSVSDFQ